MSIIERNNKIWKIQEFYNLVNEFEEDICDAIEKYDIKDELDYNNILLLIAGKAIITSREICCLSANGFADGSMSIARTLYELFIIVSFFDIHKTDSNFDDYINDYYCDYYKTNNDYYWYIASKQGYDDLKESISKSKENMKKEAIHKVRGNYWWTGFERLSEVVDNVQKSIINRTDLLIYQRAEMLYKKACTILHPNCFSNIWRIGFENKYQGINTRPTTNGHGYPLEFASISLITISKIVCEQIGIESDKYYNGFYELAGYYIKKNNDFENSENNDISE